MENEEKKKKKRIQPSIQNLKRTLCVQGEFFLDMSKIPIKRHITTSKGPSTPMKSRKNAGTNSASASTSRSMDTTTACPQDSAFISNENPLSGDMPLDLQGDNDISDDCRLYIFSIIQSKGCAFLDDDLDVCVLLDWDFSAQTLMCNNPVIVQRSHVGYTCSCDPDRQSFVNKVTSCTPQDLEDLYKKCLHINAVDNLQRKFKMHCDVVHDEEAIESVITADHCYTSHQNSCTPDENHYDIV